MSQIITASELVQLQKDENSLSLLDVRLANDFEAEHIPGATNNCVFEVVFLSRLEAKSSDLVCVYGSSEDSYESRVAAKKLEESGFTQVLELREGVKGWKTHNLETVAGEPVKKPTLKDGQNLVDTDQSFIEWTGKNLVNKHYGTIGIKSGTLTIADQSLQNGSIVIDMNDIVCTDIEDSKLNDILIQHLRGDGFFDIENYPEAQLDVTRTEKISSNLGEPNLRIFADLTLRGVTNPISFDVASGITDDGQFVAQGVLSMDRTKWNVLYGSGKFFARLSGHLVNDEINLQIKIVGKG